ncbi:MAG: hypothetical protein PHV68_08945 [Candidatus Gastranaerophilales bacterium]|jgi:hypothetical protein|nr:hypothetical protein [Candidatus Gastranaerophilales bacterium]
MKFNFFVKQAQDNDLSKKEFKKRDGLNYIAWDEVIALAIGFIVFGRFKEYGILFILATIAWYWLKIRCFESKIINKQNDIWNIAGDVRKRTEGMSVTEAAAQRMIEGGRKPIRQDLKQLEYKRKFLVEKFVIINLILLLLVQLFILK